MCDTRKKKPRKSAVVGMVTICPSSITWTQFIKHCVTCPPVSLFPFSFFYYGPRRRKKTSATYTQTCRLLLSFLTAEPNLPSHQHFYMKKFLSSTLGKRPQEYSKNWNFVRPFLVVVFSAAMCNQKRLKDRFNGDSNDKKKNVRDFDDRRTFENITWRIIKRGEQKNNCQKFYPISLFLGVVCSSSWKSRTRDVRDSWREVFWHAPTTQPPSSSSLSLSLSLSVPPCIFQRGCVTHTRE